MFMIEFKKLLNLDVSNDNRGSHDNIWHEFHSIIKSKNSLSGAIMSRKRSDIKQKNSIKN